MGLDTLEELTNDFWKHLLYFINYEEGDIFLHAIVDLAIGNRVARDIDIA